MQRDGFEISPSSAVAVIAIVSTVSVAGFAVQANGGRLPSFDPVPALRHAAHALLVAVRSPAPALVIALLLERWRPVFARQRDLTRGFLQDLLWYLLDFAAQFGWVPLLVALLAWIKLRLIGPSQLLPAGVLPEPLVWTLGVLVADFLGYAGHVIRHRVDALWRFHAVHHSQRELNFFSQHRFHQVDTVVQQTISAGTLLLLDASWTAVGLFSGIALAHFQLYHSSIRSDYGVLRYVLVTPQSHRIHHSRDPRHQDTNFGIIFSLWDHLFGTQYRRYDEYPEALGIDDPSFPIEQGTRPRTSVRVLAAQLLYPFVERRQRPR